VGNSEDCDVLREDSSAGVWKERSYGVLTDYTFRRGKLFVPLHPRFAKASIAKQKSEPVRVCERDGQHWWWFRDRFYRTTETLEPGDVTALVRQLDERKAARLERAHAELRGEHAARVREPIPEAVRHEVWRRDKGRCVDCGSRERLELDHIIPVSAGGSSTARNIELRCEDCNRRKGALI
jgi:5-methylcytosine-specific restriction endonuclease McrA